MVDFSLPNPEASDIDAVQAEHREGCRKAANWQTIDPAEDFLQAQPTGKMILGAITPVIEITGNDQWRVRIGKGFQIVGKRPQLLSSGVAE